MKIATSVLITTLNLFFSQLLNAEFMIAAFESRNSFYLNVTSLETIFVNDNMDCSFACVKNTLCVSFNLAVLADDKGNHRCDLLPTTSYNNEGKFVVDHHFHHFTMKNPCSSRPCLNGGNCSATSIRRHGTYECTCHPEYLGSHCEIAAPECHHYVVLNQPDRHHSYRRDSKSDSSLIPGWYRFQSSEYTKMLDTCISHHRCSTDIPGWLNGAHPSLQDGIVDREACFNGFYKCCYRKVQIRVRRCGGFYVYYLNPSPAGLFRYCTTA